jgi:hypothetical protein
MPQLPLDPTRIPYPVRHADADSIGNHVDLELPGSRPRFQNFTLLAGQLYARGSVMGQVTASGKLTLSASAAGDGSQNPIAVLNTDVDATGGDVTFDVYVGGAVLNQDALVLGTGMTLAAVEAALIARGFAFRHVGFSG